MATAVKKASCFTCGKEKGGAICAGCSKMFCLNHFNDHRQELNNQLDEVQVTRDLFRQSLTESTSEPQEHPLIEEINQWETESINKIQQAAEEARQLLIQHTTGLNTKVEERLKQLTNQLRQSREENEFFETDLNQWKEELTRMENELIKPLNVTIRQDPTPLVTRITVDISSDSYNMEPRTSTNEATENTDVQKQLIFCPICIEEFASSKAMEDHLMMCGNKTEQCPNCKTYIQRCVFRYHYENNCANSDDSTTNDNNNQTHASNRSCETNDSKNDSHIPCEWCNKGILWSLYEDHTKTCREEHERQQQQQQPRLSSQNTIFPTNNVVTLVPMSPVVMCAYCGAQRLMTDLAFHQIYCLKNPHRTKN